MADRSIIAIDEIIQIDPIVSSNKNRHIIPPPFFVSSYQYMQNEGQNVSQNSGSIKMLPLFFYSKKSASNFICLEIGSCWGHSASHAPHFTHCDAFTSKAAYFRCATGFVLLTTEL